MYFCYLDESGTPELAGQTSHFILLGIAIPAAQWRDKDRQITAIKIRHRLEIGEIHTGYLARRYPEQERIPNFVGLGIDQRREEVKKIQDAAMLRAATTGTPERLKSLKKLYRLTKDYIHLTRDERIALLRALADEIGSWSDTRLFAEAILKARLPMRNSAFEQAFEQVVTRLHRFLEERERQRIRRGGSRAQVAAMNLGLIIQDNNETVAKNLTNLMRRFHDQGTLFAAIPRIIETPLFVNSELTSLVQMADLCAYSTRRFFENGETDLFDRIFGRFDVARQRIVGIRHYTGGAPCACKVCRAHRA